MERANRAKTELGKILGVDRTTIGFYEEGERMPSIGFLHGKQAGKEAYAFVFFLLFLGGYAVYKGLEQLKLWALAWPLCVKIMVPSTIGIGIIAVVILIVLFKKRRY